MKDFKVKARYFNRSIEFEVEAVDLANAIHEGETIAKLVFKKAMAVNALQFWSSDGKISVKEIKSH